MLLTYGVISPIAAAGIGFNICSQIVLLSCSIRLYTNLQLAADTTAQVSNRSSSASNDITGSSSNNSSRVPPPLLDEFHIETMCKRTYMNSHYMLWPGLIVSVTLFGLYLFDMAYDVEGLPVLSAPLCIMIATWSISPVAIWLYYKGTARVKSTLEDRRKESMSDDRYSSAKVVGVGGVGGDSVNVEKGEIFNPLRLELLDR